MAANSKRVTLELYCNLTEEEIRDTGMMLVETVQTIDDVNHARSAAMKEFKDRLTGLMERQRELSKIIREQAEKRVVHCAVLFHTPAEATKRIVRIDTGEVVREEAMTAAECQLNIFGSQVEFEEFMREQLSAEPEAEKQTDKPEDMTDGAGSEV